MQRLLNARNVAAVAALASAPAFLARFASDAHSSGTSSASLAPPPPALSPSEFRAFKLVSAEQLTHDTKKYTFALPRENDTLGLTVASCLVVKAGIDGKDVVRPYTPTSPVNQRGSMELIVKSYPEGKISKHFWNLKPGDSLEMKGPFQKFAYTPNQWSAVGMVAGGSGITPMYQLLLSILSNPRDRTEVRLVYASRSANDIILKEELDALAAVYPNFKVLYTVDKAEDGWKGATGVVTKEMLASFLPPAAEENGAKHKVLVCGPPGFMKHLSGDKKSPSDQGELIGLLKDMKYTPEQVFKY